MARWGGRRLTIVVVAVIVLIASLGTGCAKPLPPIASSVTTLDALGYSAIALDDLNGHLFVSSAQSGVVTVLDLGGTVVASLPVPGAGRMVRSGGTLYVGTSSGSIERIDVASLTVGTPLATGLGGPVVDLVFAGGRVWTQVSLYYFNGTVLDAIDPASGTVRSWTNRQVGLFDSPVALAAGPTAPQIFAIPTGEGPLPIGRIDISGPDPTVTYQSTESPTFPLVSAFGDFTVSPDGRWLYVAAVWQADRTGYVVRRMNTSDLTFDAAIYPLGPYPLGVAVTGAMGGRVAMTAVDGPVQVYASEDPTIALVNQRFDSPTNELLPRGVAISAYGNRVFAISGDSFPLDPVNRPNYVRVNIFTVP